MASPGISNADPMQDASSTGAKPVSRLKSITDLTNQLDALQRARQLQEAQWKLSLAFYRGKQYAYYNKASKRIEQLPVDDGDKPRFRVRIVANITMAGCQQLVAKYTKTKPVMHATPGTASDRDLKAAQMAERLLEYWWVDFQLDDALEEVLLWSIVCGQGFWEVSWDAHAGKQMTYLLGPDGQPVVDQTLADLFKSELNQRNIEPREQVVYLGDLCVKVRSPFDVYGDPTVRNWSECKWCMAVSYLDPDTIKARWGVDLAANAVNASPDVTLPVANSQPAMEQNVRKVVTAWFKPQPGAPKGRIVTWAPGHGKALEDKKWDLPTHDLPLIKFGGIRVPGEIYDSAIVEHVIPLQKELNRTISQIVEYKNLTIKPQWMAPVGSLRTRLTNEPGAVFEFTPIGGLVPTPVQVPSLPNYVFTHVEEIRQRAQEVFGNADVLQGQVPPNVEAGVAIDLLQEMATDRQAPTIKLMEASLARAGYLMLAMAKTYYVEPRLLKIRGFGGSTQVKEFSHADIDGAVDVIAEAGSGLPRTRAGRQARLEWMMSQGMLRPDQAMKYADVADLTGVQAILQLDEDEAMREHDAFVAGTPFNQVAMQQAEQAVQQGVDPDSGQPLQSPEQAQQIVQYAGFKPSYFQNHQVHMDIHTRTMKSTEYQAWPVERQQLLMQHVSEHFQIWMSFPAQVQPQAARVNYQIKSTIGPDAASKVLQKAGVPTTADEMAEPPMDTWVSDSIDKPNAEGDPRQSSPAAAMAEMAQAQQAQQQVAQQQEQHRLQQAQRAQQMHHAEQQAGHRQQQHEAQLAQLHQRAEAIRSQLRERAKAK